MTNKSVFEHKSTMLRICWVVQGVVEGSTISEAYAKLASNRYRAILPAQAIEDLGHKVSFVSQMESQWFAETEPQPDVLIIGKLLPNSHIFESSEFQSMADHVLKQIENAKAKGIVVIADFNDYHFHHPIKGVYWSSLAKSVDYCIAGTKPMANLLRQFTSAPIRVITDPIAAPFYPAKVFEEKKGIKRKISNLIGAPSQNVLKLIWYGNLSNWPAMEQWVNVLSSFQKEQFWLLHVVTKPHPEVLDFIEKFNSKNNHQFTIKFEEWSERRQWELVEDADIVLIPSDVNHRANIVKTSNRLTDALYAGRYVIASPLPSYLPYSEVVSLTNDPRSAINNYIKSPNDALKKIKKGQKMVSKQLNSVEIAGLWIDAILDVLHSKSKNEKIAANAHDSTVDKISENINPIRLNLGCGDKVMQGYINVDVVPSRQGKTPDILSDLKELSVFSDNYADEILAVHVVEHFWRWEIEDVLREWLRILKPGGEMILECPNLISACEEFLKNPEKNASEGQEGQRTMWVFYGDPAWKDPYMIHRWGYTPSSLKKLMEEVGLINVRQEAAQFKLKEPRDMRMVGQKIR